MNDIVFKRHCSVRDVIVHMLWYDSSISEVASVGPGDSQSLRVQLNPNQTHLKKLIKVQGLIEIYRQVRFNQG